MSSVIRIVALADVAGHGIGPALVTAVCRAYSRAITCAENDLGTLLGRLNDPVAEDLPPDRFITFVACLLDHASARVQILSAGHGPVLLYQASENWVTDIKPHHVPLGVAAGLPFGPPQDIELGLVDMVFLVTDGFFEWADASGECFGIERLHETIRAFHSLSCDEIIARLYERVLTFSDGTTQADDLTAVIIKWKPG